jgi:class 3 adenylate cyclase
MRGRPWFLPEYLLIAFAAWVCLAWLGTRPVPGDIGMGAEGYHGVFRIPLKVLQAAPDAASLKLAFFALLAVTTLLACALAAILLARSAHVPAARTLAISLAAGAASVAYNFYVRIFPALGSERIAGWEWAFDFVGSGLYAISLIAGARFFATYPFAIELSAFVRQEVGNERVAGAVGRLSHLYRKVARWRKPQTAEERARANEKAFAWFAQPRSQALVALAYAAMGAVSTASVVFWALHSVAGMMVAIYIFWFGLACLRYKYKRALEDDRQRIQWLYFGAWTAALMLLGWALVAVLAPLGGFGYYGMTAFATLPSFAPVLAGLIGLLSLAVSIFYRGAIDPGLAIRRTTVYTMLLALLGCLFVVLERMLAAVAAARLGLDAEMGVIVAGGLAGVLLLPLRRFVERGANRLVERFTPVTVHGDGPRHNAAVVFSDLSGYTALTARDERAAMIVVALFHREAKRACEQHGGRLVKTIGDAVHLELPTAQEALAAVRQLHHGYPKAAALLDLPALQIHSGVHYGEVMAASDGDIYGTVVNVAARLQAQARDGEIVVSREVREACAEERFNDLGSVALKNVPGKVELYALAC